MAKFTSGPWEWDNFSGYIFSPTYEFPIAHITNPHNSFYDECSEELAKELEANARLIAFAPEMYQLLLDCAEFLEERSMLQCEGCSEFASFLQNKVEELINKID